MIKKLLGSLALAIGLQALPSISQAAILAGPIGGGSGASSTSSSYGAIYISSSFSSQTISTTPAKLTIFNQNGLSNRTTPDHTNDQITISTSGVFFVYGMVQATATAGVASDLYYGIRVNGTTTPISNKSSGGATNPAVFAGILNLSSGNVVSVYVNGFYVSELTYFSDAQLVVSAVGGSSSGSGGSNLTDIYNATSTAGLPYGFTSSTSAYIGDYSSSRSIKIISTETFANQGQASLSMVFRKPDGSYPSDSVLFQGYANTGTSTSTYVEVQTSSGDALSQSAYLGYFGGGDTLTLPKNKQRLNFSSFGYSGKPYIYGTASDGDLILVPGSTNNRIVMGDGTQNGGYLKFDTSGSDSDIVYNGSTNLLTIPSTLTVQSLINVSSIATISQIRWADGTIQVSSPTAGGGGGGTPALPFNSVQYNNAGAFGGSSSFLYDSVTSSITNKGPLILNPSGTVLNPMNTIDKSYTRFFSVPPFWEGKNVYHQIVLDQLDGGSYITRPVYYMYVSSDATPGGPFYNSNAGVYLAADSSCPNAVLYASGGTTSSGSSFSAGCSDATIQNALGEQFFASNTYGMGFLTLTPVQISGTSTSGSILFRDNDGSSPNDGVVLKAPSNVDQIAGLDNLVLVLPSTGGAIGDVLKISAISNNEYSLAFGTFSSGGSIDVSTGGYKVATSTSVNIIGTGATTVSAVQNGNRTDITINSTIGSGGASALAVGTGTVSAYQQNVSSPTAILNYDKNYFNVQLTGSATAFTTLNTSSVTVQGTLLAGSNITLTPGAGTLTIAASASGGGGYSIEPATKTVRGDYGVTSSTFTASSTATFNGPIILNSSSFTKTDVLAGPSFTCASTLGCSQMTYQTAVTSTVIQALVFPYGTTNFADITFPVNPARVANSTFTVNVIWSSTSTTGNVVWKVSSKISTDTMSLDGSFGTAVSITDGANLNLSMNQSADSPAMTPGGTNDVGVGSTTNVSMGALTIRIMRDADPGNTMTGEARLLYLPLTYFYSRLSTR